MIYRINPEFYYSHKLDSDRVKEYVDSHQDAFEAELLGYLLNAAKKIHKEYLTEHLKNRDIQMLFKFNDWKNAEDLQDVTFAVVTQSMCVVYNPVERDSCIVFLLPYLRHFTGCMLYNEIHGKYHLAVAGAKESEHQKNWSITNGVYISQDIAESDSLEKPFEKNGNSVNEYLKASIGRTFADYDHFFEFTCKLWDILVEYDYQYGIKTGDGPKEKKPYVCTDPRNYYEEELLDIVYGAFCYCIKEELSQKNFDVSFCDKGELKISTPIGAKHRESSTDSVPKYIERRVEGWVDITKNQPGWSGWKTRSKCIIKFKIDNIYQIRNYEIRKMKYLSMKSKLRTDYYESGDNPMLEKVVGGVGCGVLILGLILFPIAMFQSCTHRESESTMDIFEKDPNDWTDREEERVNEFFDWQDDYQEDH